MQRGPFATTLFRPGSTSFVDRSAISLEIADYSLPEGAAVVGAPESEALGQLAVETGADRQAEPGPAAI